MDSPFLFLKLRLDTGAFSKQSKEVAELTSCPPSLRRSDMRV